MVMGLPSSSLRGLVIAKACREGVVVNRLLCGRSSGILLFLRRAGAALDSDVRHEGARKSR